MFPYVTRADWAARPPKARRPLGRYEGIFLHHSVTATAPEIQQVQQIQRLHQDVRGWYDIAYSWLVGDSGTIYEGRGADVEGGHTEGWNSRAEAVCYIGNAETGRPSPAALASIRLVIEDRNAAHGGGFVRPHRAVAATACPGTALVAWLSAGMPVQGAPDPTPVPVPPANPLEDEMPLVITVKDTDEHWVWTPGGVAPVNVGPVVGSWLVESQVCRPIGPVEGTYLATIQGAYKAAGLPSS